MKNIVGTNSKAARARCAEAIDLEKREPIDNTANTIAAVTRRRLKWIANRDGKTMKSMGIHSGVNTANSPETRRTRETISNARRRCTSDQGSPGNKSCRSWVNSLDRRICSPVRGAALYARLILAVSDR